MTETLELMEEAFLDHRHHLFLGRDLGCAGSEPAPVTLPDKLLIFERRTAKPGDWWIRYRNGGGRDGKRKIC